MKALPDDGSRVQRLATTRVQVPEVKAGENLDHRLTGNMLKIQGAARLHGCGRDSERQWMTAGKSVDRVALSFRDIDKFQQLLCVRIGQRR